MEWITLLLRRTAGRQSSRDKGQSNWEALAQGLGVRFSFLQVPCVHREKAVVWPEWTAVSSEAPQTWLLV